MAEAQAEACRIVRQAAAFLARQGQRHVAVGTDQIGGVAQQAGVFGGFVPAKAVQRQAEGVRFRFQARAAGAVDMQLPVHRLQRVEIIVIGIAHPGQPVATKDLAGAACTQHALLVVDLHLREGLEHGAPRGRKAGQEGEYMRQQPVSHQLAAGAF